MTLRELMWMADGRQRAEWGRVASLAASIHKDWTGEAIDPETMIPDRYRARRSERAKTGQQLEAESSAAWILLDRAFRG